MSLASAADVPLQISSANASSERRISPSWTIAHLKTRLEPITGIPASCQQLTLRLGSHQAVAITAADEESTQLAAFPLQPQAEITVSRLVFSTAPYCPSGLSRAATSSPLIKSPAFTVAILA